MHPRKSCSPCCDYSASEILRIRRWEPLATLANILQRCVRLAAPRGSRRASLFSVMDSPTARFGSGVFGLAFALLVASCERTAESTPHPRERARVEPVGEGEDLPCVEINNTSRCWHERCDHMITLTNGCGAPVDCDVASDIDPGWVRVHLDAGQFFEITLRHSAESRDFEIRRKCWYWD